MSSACIQNFLSSFPARDEQCLDGSNTLCRYGNPLSATSFGMARTVRRVHRASDTLQIIHRASDIISV
jgi:hypothetical protein